MTDDFTMSLRLCDDDGMVAGEYINTLNRLRGLSNNPDTRRPYEGDPFPCTGSAHLAGEHVRCTSPAHSPLRVEHATKERVGLTAEEMFGNRRWVLDANGRLVERYGLPWDGDSDTVIQTITDALPDRPDPIADPLPEDFERWLRDPEILTGRDHALHFWLADYLRRTPDATVTREAYLNLWALYEKECERGR